MDGMTCPRCDQVNPRDASSCVSCGLELQGKKDTSRVQADIFEARAPVPAALRSGGPSPVVLVGFGAITALAAAAYPWYLFGGDQGQATTLSELAEVGWRGFPGTPLALILIAAIAATTATLFPRLGSLRAPTVVASGLVTLVSAGWLAEGITRLQSGSVDSTLPITGATLQTIGAMVLIAAGFWLGRTQANKGASSEHAPATSAADASGDGDQVGT